MTMITPSYLGETIEYSSLHACRSTLEDPTDFPHLDHPGNYMSELRELVEPMSAATRQKVIGDNVAKVYGI